MSKEKSGMNGYRNILGNSIKRRCREINSEYGKDVYENGRVKCIELNAIYVGRPCARQTSLRAKLNAHDVIKLIT